MPKILQSEYLDIINFSIKKKICYCTNNFLLLLDCELIGCRGFPLRSRLGKRSERIVCMSNASENRIRYK